ncbi:hypothetical protein AAZX31_20G069900 [Glycine max]|uniref:DUF7081 domain-containing protein n=1 Tax=Glycine max TaxID=3847 RepID=I1NEI7_SOYBN|nr:uncharacterized protein LOC100809860 isoform X1 [Glycine max]KAG4909719.1 hypothetical protein JHK87_055835 [Glycine soja]KAG5074379.1 hypothetical protein JHK84_055610 [Glycine max]KAH1035083.1 hypothetical protein GYH30_055172 [Glycine max]KAH1189910.1 hypothetical protein GmHk_20G057588 [Glycine max]KRG90260.1 hypothetical protein GLYMA_20G078300v4 [Glycine max]|eukprot:XP_003555717.1 uncharacterized protein LOC100809860 isoform X1 [Glycine max]
MALPDTLTSTPTSSMDERESLKNDTPICSNACKDVTKEKTFYLQPVSPFSSGVGLPYAPEGWPSPGDVWGWKVAKRMNSFGYFIDRFLTLPRSLETSRRKTELRSKADISRYLQSNFPDMKIEAFLALFSWQIPSTQQTPTKAVESLETGEDATDEIGTQRKKLKLETGSVSHPTEKSLGLLALQSSETGEDATDKTGTTGKKLKRKTRSVGRPPNKKSFGLVQGRPHLTPDQVAKFDDYLDTLEDMLVMPEIETTPSDNLTPTILDDNETIECCKKKLSSLLAVDFSSLVSRGDVAEVATLAAQIREDPSLSVDQLFKLKLVEQVPLASEAFLEAKKNIEEVDNFLADLEAKKLKVPSLRKEYNELKDKIGQQEAEMDISTLTIREIDDQIRQLQAKRNRITNGLETMKKTKAELTSELTNVANSISTIGHDIKHGLSQKSKLELKKANNIRRVAEIQEKFITLRGLTF